MKKSVLLPMIYIIITISCEHSFGIPIDKIELSVPSWLAEVHKLKDKTELLEENNFRKEIELEIEPADTTPDIWLYINGNLKIKGTRTVILKNYKDEIIKEIKNQTKDTEIEITVYGQSIKCSKNIKVNVYYETDNCKCDCKCQDECQCNCSKSENDSTEKEAC